MSELMLQQTQVARVIERWPRFLDRFPTVTACADAPIAAVIDEWQGLGYNRRAVNLHRAAIIVRDQFHGVLPADRVELLGLPGIGPYTARAVRAFSFELGDGVVDTNIGRVLARVGGWSLRPPQAQLLADALVPAGLGWEWNQALMEVGALLCRPAPRCGECPLADCCSWHQASHPDPDPARGSAAVSTTQSRFEGSDRQGRGRLVDALRTGPVGLNELDVVMGWPEDHERVERVVSTLIADGLAERRRGALALPS